MAKLVYISKYPPLEGGIAAKTYWLVQAMAKRGHTIDVVTDSLDVDKIHTTANINSIPNPPGVEVHRPEHQIPWHIPNDSHNTTCLLEKTIEIVEKVKPDVIVAGYLVPYGLVAYLAHQITGIPYILNHGGSDINKFVGAGLWSNLWGKVFSNAKGVITDIEQQPEIKRWGANSHISIPYVPDPVIFTPEFCEQRNLPVLALIGKANYHWQYKGWHRVIDLWAKMGNDFKFKIISQGVGIEGFKDYVDEHLGNGVTWHTFVPPWVMPSILRSIDVIFNFEADLPFSTFSNILLEALSCSVVVISDQEDIIKRYRLFGLDLKHQSNLILRVPEQNPNLAAKIIMDFLPPVSAFADSGFSVEYDHYLSDNEKLFIMFMEQQKL